MTPIEAVVLLIIAAVALVFGQRDLDGLEDNHETQQ